jgi:hypothetical protein
MFEIINKNTKKRCSGLKGDLCPRKQPPGRLPIICTLERLGNEPTAARRVSLRCSRDCPGVLVVASLEETQGVLSRSDCVYSDYITQGCTGGALVGWRWHHSRRRRVCSRVLTACIQTSSLKGAQGVLWWVGGGITRGDAGIALTF